MFPTAGLNRLLAVLAVISILTGCGGAEERKAKYMERGKSYFEQQNFEKATVEFKNVLQIDPKTAGAYYYFGRIAEEGKDWRKAFSGYSKAVELDPSLLDARIHLGRMFILIGESDKADEQASAVLSSEPGNTDAQTLRAAVLVKRDKLDEAINILQGVLEKSPGDESAATLLSAIYGKRKNPVAAINVLEKASAANPASAALRLGLVHGYLAGNENAKAEAQLLTLVKEFPAEQDYRVMLATFYNRNNQEDLAEDVLRKSIEDAPDEVSRYMVLVNFLKTRKGVDKAIAEMEQMRAAKPEMTELSFSLASMYMDNKQPGKAEELFDAIIMKHDKEPDGLKAKTAIAVIRVNEGKVDEAEKLIDEVLSMNALDRNALMLRGRIQMQGKQYDAAVATYRTLLKDQPDSAEVLMLLAAAHQANGETALAEELLSRAVTVEPANVHARLRMAQFLVIKNDLDQALVNVDAALAVAPEDLAALRVKAEILAKKGDMTELEQVLNKMEQSAPGSGLGAFGKGRLYRSQKKYPEAMSAFEEALKREPGSAMILVDLIKTYLESGDSDGALARLKAIPESSPDYSVVHYLNGVVLGSKEDYAGAEAEFLKQLDVNPQSSEIYTLISKARVHQGNPAGAEAIMDQGLKALPDNANIQINLAALYKAEGQDGKMIAVLQKGMNAHPEDERFAQALAGYRESEKKYEDAIKLYEGILARNPSNLLAINNLAVLLSEHRSDQESKDRALVLAKELANANQPALRDTLGWIYYGRGDFDKAAEILSDVVEKAPDVGVFRYHLGLTFYRQGDIRAAREILSRATDDKQQYEGVEEARRIYKEILKK